MNALLNTEAIICAKKCLLLPYFEESIHKAKKNLWSVRYFVSVNFTSLTQQAFTCSNLTIETIEQGVTCVQS